jgi:hypothetical protein
MVVALGHKVLAANTVCSSSTAAVQLQQSELPHSNADVSLLQNSCHLHMLHVQVIPV